MKGYIGLSRHKIDCIIGVYPEEREKTQALYIDLKVESDFTKCSKSDDVQDTVNYELLAQICTELAESQKYKLLETFAVDVLQEIFRRFKISKAWIYISKPNGISSADSTTVELELSDYA